jgi:RHS repeat-associated protein
MRMSRAAFDNLSHVAVMGRVRARVKDKRVLVLVSYPNGDTVTSTYDNDDDLTGTSVSSTSTILASIRYTRNADSLVTEETDSGGLNGDINYTYTAQNQLSSAGTSTYQYDPAGNLTTAASASQTFNTADQLTTSTVGTSTTTYAYDATGDRTSTTPPSGSATSYGYNQAGELTSVTQGGTAVATYGYNGDGLRMTETASGTGALTFTWDTNQPIPQVLDDATSYYGQGYTDPATGLIYLLNRYYDPTSGQFMSVDPDVAMTGQPYTYTADDPMNESDPTGLWS